MILTALITVFGAYLLGSVNFAVIFSTLFSKRDIRDYGSGNAGATNVLRVMGVLPGVLTFVCDALKGVLACLAGKWIFSFIYGCTANAWALAIYGGYICGLACMIGHIFPIFFRFKGGKGVACGAGIFLVCCPIAIGIGMIVFIAVTLLSRMVSLGSVTATATVVLFALIFRDTDANFLPQAVLCVAMGTMIVLKHKENIKRIISGKESKIFERR